jgi:NADH:ubiquinone oxidoreductase subunit C
VPVLTRIEHYIPTKNLVKDKTINIITTSVFQPKISIFLKKSSITSLNCLSESLGLDSLNTSKQYTCTYNLLSTRFNIRIQLYIYGNTIKTFPSLKAIYGSADWQEREIWELLGFNFHGHTDLRRLLLDYGFIGHPLRKDFPLEGLLQTTYNYITKTIIYEPVNMAQKFRNFPL